MSFVTDGATELLYASLKSGAAATPAAATEVQINDTATMGVQARLEPDFWLPNNNQTCKTIHITGRGIWSTGTVSPNITISVRLGAAGVTGPVVLASTTGALTASTVAGAWFMEGDVIVSVMGAAGAHSTVQGYGAVTSGNYASLFIAAMTGTAATLDTSITNYINFTALWSTAGCSITLQQLLVYGLN